MTITFTEEEQVWLEKSMFNWHVKDDAPEGVRESIESKLKLLSGEKLIKKATTYEELKKFNPYHGADGRFTSANSAASFTFRTKNPLMQGAADKAKEREQKRTAEAEKPKFAPAKTMKEATKFAQEELGIRDVRFGKLDLEVVNQMNQSIAEHFKDFPELKNEFNFVGSCQQNAKLYVERRKAEMYDNEYNTRIEAGYSEELAKAEVNRVMAFYEKRGLFKPSRVSGDTLAYSIAETSLKNQDTLGIAVNEKYGSKASVITQTIQSTVERKFHPEGAGSIKGIVDHELGHRLDKLVGASKDTQVRKVYDDLLAKDNGGSEAVKNELSRYAYHRANRNPNKYGEFVAEAWAEYKNNPNCRPVAKQVGERMEQLYKERVKTR